MSTVYYYLDFLAKSFDGKSKTSRKSFWVVLIFNTVLMVLLVSVGLAVPKGRPLQIYIAFSSLVSTPLIPAYVTLILRRLNDIGMNCLYALLMLVPMGLGMIPLLWLCGQKSAYQTAEDLSAYQSLETKIRILADSLKNAMVVYPFIYLIYMGIKLVMRSGIIGANAALFSINLLICGLTILGIYKPKVQEAIPFLVTLKKLTILSNAMLTVMLYQDTQSAMEAIMIVYLYFYVMISPILIVMDTVKALKSRESGKSEKRNTHL